MVGLVDGGVGGGGIAVGDALLGGLPVGALRGVVYRTDGGLAGACHGGRHEGGLLEGDRPEGDRHRMAIEEAPLVVAYMTYPVVACRGGSCGDPGDGGGCDGG